MNRFWLVVLCGACSSEVVEPVMCEQPTGAYVLLLQARGEDDCSVDGLSLAVNFGNETAIGSENCSGDQSISDNGCSIQSDISCGITDGLGVFLGVLDLVGSVKQAPPSPDLSGVFTILYTDDTDPSFDCVGTYDVTYNRVGP